MNAEVAEASEYLLEILFEDIKEKIEERECPKLKIVEQDESDEPPFYSS